MGSGVNDGILAPAGLILPEANADLPPGLNGEMFISGGTVIVSDGTSWIELN